MGDNDMNKTEPQIDWGVQAVNEVRQLKERIAAHEADIKAFARRISALEAKIAEPHDTLNAIIWRVDQLHEAYNKQRLVNEALLAWADSDYGDGDTIEPLAAAISEALR